MVMRECGFPKYEYASERGDLFVEFSVAFPESVSANLAMNSLP